MMSELYPNYIRINTGPGMEKAPYRCGLEDRLRGFSMPLNRAREDLQLVVYGRCILSLKISFAINTQNR